LTATASYLPILTSRPMPQARPAVIGTPEGSPLVDDLQQQLHELRNAVVAGFSRLLELKDLSTSVHSCRLAEWAVLLADRLGLDCEAQQDVKAAALLHDIGKIGIPDAILQKPGALTPEERAIINKHSEYGWNALRIIPGFERVSLFVLHHHERIDGTGYPAGLRGEDIPLGSRIVCVIDAFDAMVSNRCYRKGMSLQQALHRLRGSSSTQFDPEVVNLFVRIVVPSLSQGLRRLRPVPFNPPRIAERKA